MPDVFGVEGPQRNEDPKGKDKAKKPPSRGEPDMLWGSQDPKAGETQKGRYFQYDNESGAMIVDLPERFSKYKRELEEELLDEFLGEPGGAAESGRSIDAWIKAWIEKKEQEDPELGRPGVE